MHNGTPYVSIIVPVYNASRTLSTCITLLLQQNYPASQYEIIVIDDSSTDNSLAIAEQYAVRILSCSPNQGPAAARNKGARQARGELLLFLDADCAAPSYWIQAHVHLHRSMSQNQKKVCVGGSIMPPKKDTFIGWCDYFSTWYTPPQQKNTQGYEYLPSTNFSVAKHAFLESGGFNALLRCGEDVEFGKRWRGRGYVFLFSPEINITHYNRTSLSFFLLHHYESGFYAPRFRHYGSGLAYHWLFYPNILFTCCVAPGIVMGFTVYVMCVWLLKRQYKVFWALPFIFLSKIAFAWGVIHGIHRYGKELREYIHD